MNVSLLCKWWWKLDNEEGLGQEITKFKYLRGESVCTMSHRQSDSPIWSDLLKVKDIYLQGRKIESRNGKKTLFLIDTWIYCKPLCILFLDLFKLCEQPGVSVYQVKADSNVITFTIWLVDDLRVSWDNIMRDVANVHLVNEKDSVLWKFWSKGHFTVKSAYNALTANDAGPFHKKIWNGKILAKIKIFLWLIMTNAILTKDNLIRRKWLGSPTCYFCDEDESVSHLLFQCSSAKAVWAIIIMLFVLMMFPETYKIVGHGVKSGFLLVKSFTPWALLLCVGLFGKHETVSALKAKK